MDWIAQIALAVEYIHSQRVLHRDLKTQNVFLTRYNVVKIGDFGISRILEKTLDQAETVVGTPFYVRFLVPSRRSIPVSRSSMETSLASLASALADVTGSVREQAVRSQVGYVGARVHLVRTMHAATRL